MFVDFDVALPFGPEVVRLTEPGALAGTESFMLEDEVSTPLGETFLIDPNPITVTLRG